MRQWSSDIEGSNVSLLLRNEWLRNLLRVLKDQASTLSFLLDPSRCRVCYETVGEVIVALEQLLPGRACEESTCCICSRVLVSLEQNSSCQISMRSPHHVDCQEELAADRPVLETQLHLAIPPKARCILSGSPSVQLPHTCQNSTRCSTRIALEPRKSASRAVRV